MTAGQHASTQLSVPPSARRARELPLGWETLLRPLRRAEHPPLPPGTPLPDLLSTVEELLHRLPAEERALLWAIAAQGHSTSQAARAHDLSVKQVRGRLSRAVTRLKPARASVNQALAPLRDGRVHLLDPETLPQLRLLTHLRRERTGVISALSSHVLLLSPRGVPLAPRLREHLTPARYTTPETLARHTKLSVPDVQLLAHVHPALRTCADGRLAYQAWTTAQVIEATAHVLATGGVHVWQHSDMARALKYTWPERFPDLTGTNLRAPLNTAHEVFSGAGMPGLYALNAGHHHAPVS